MYNSKDTLKFDNNDRLLQYILTDDSYIKKKNKCTWDIKRRHKPVRRRKKEKESEK